MAGLPVRLRGLLTAAVLGPALALSLTASAAPQPPAFDAWLEGVKRDAAAAGISEPTIEAALAGVRPIERVLELDRRQPEFTSTFWAYLDRSVTPARIERGRRLLAQHRDLLERVRGEYNVQPRSMLHAGTCSKSTPPIRASSGRCSRRCAHRTGSPRNNGPGTSAGCSS